MSNTLSDFNVKDYTASEINTQQIYMQKVFNDHYNYYGTDLGVHYSPTQTLFKIWAPLANQVLLNLYSEGSGDNLIHSYPLCQDIKGTWSLTLVGDFNNVYYTFTVKNPNATYEVVDSYAKAVGVNGKRGMIFDFSATHPAQWSLDHHIVPNTPVDAIIYELHIRDLSIAPNSGILYKGKYLGATEYPTQTSDGTSTGLSHIKELGVTHVHLLPIYDYNSVDESHLESNCFNWGYDPLNYNALEGSYSTDPHNGTTRIKEFKKLVQAFHKQGIGVIMDVVYNHTAEAENSYLHQTVPYYYHRCHKDGTFNDGSACGNEIASERFMVRKMIIDSVTFWAKEYHIDGFRFDLMGILDIETMNAIRQALDEINPNILMYGEGWVAAPLLLPEEKSAIKINTPMLDSRIASFSDDMRDAIKGHVFYEEEAGFVNGDTNFVESIKFGIVASTYHPQVDYTHINYSKAPWALQPTQCITYASAHDNYTLFDKLQLTMPDASIDKLIQMNKMAATLVLTSQGISFIHAGEEFLRTKVNPDGTLEHNSYCSPDSVNQLDWSRKSCYRDVFNYYQGLIALRKAHPAFRMSTAKDIVTHLKFIELPHSNCVGYSIEDYHADSWKYIGIFFNPNDETVKVTLPNDRYVIVVDPTNAGLTKLGLIENGQLILEPHSHYVIVDETSYNSH